jgi:hypothetical protein
MTADSTSGRTTQVPLQRGTPHEVRQSTSNALVEQAKGVLIFRYAVDADTAQAVLELWAAESHTDVLTVAIALVRDICQGAEPARSDAGLVRSLEDRLRKDCPEVHLAMSGGTSPVVVAVDCAYSSLDEVVAAAGVAARRQVPLEIRVAEPDPAEGPPPSRSHLIQRIDLAVELARAVEPGLEVRLPASLLLSPAPHRKHA